MEWKPEYGLIFFGAFCGALFRYVNLKGDIRPVVKALVSQLIAAIIAGAIGIGTFYNYLNLSVITAAMCAFPFGLGIEKGLVLLMDFLDASDGFLDFINRVFKAYRAASKAGDSTTNTTDQTK